jgi:hypothetical protein
MATLIPGIPPSTLAFSRMAGRLVKKSEEWLATEASLLMEEEDVLLTKEIEPRFGMRNVCEEKERKRRRDDLDKRGIGMG